jgi:hypothetical protein
MASHAYVAVMDLASVRWYNIPGVLSYVYVVVPDSGVVPEVNLDKPS